MIQFEKFDLENGLRVIVHEDHSTPMAVMNIMYNVGARDENPEQTGFAHLFEHLMFGGSVNIPDYDEPLQMAGGENNAYTTNDITNYYIQIPSINLETAFWLESDRMLSLAFDEKSLETQRKVVCEEFKEHYINKPYGDVGHKLRELMYKVHPYRWMTIGKDLSHVENAQLQDVKNFFFKHYTPANAVMVIAGDVTVEKVKELSLKWFADIPSGVKYDRNLPAEPEQTEARTETVEAEVPLDALYKSWHMASRLEPGYYMADLITEILGGGASSRLYEKLVKERKLFSSIDCHHMGSVEKGMMLIEGKLIKGVKMEDADAAVEELVNTFLQEGVEEKELQKAKNKTESLIAFEDMSLMNRAGSLAFYEILGDANLINLELSRFQAVTAEELMGEAKHIFRKENSNTLYYHSKMPAQGLLVEEEDLEEDEMEINLN
jgi:predicted Zn-dependent peptidase